MRVLQIIDSLDAGGAERMAVQIANELYASGHESHLCVTRKEGLLKETVQEHVGYIFIEKKGKLGIKAMTKLKTYIVKNNIQIIHAHSTSFFTATIIKLWLPSMKLVWHDHYGNAEEVQNRKVGVIKLCSSLFNGIISVNENLKSWAQSNLNNVPIIYLRNFVSTPQDSGLVSILPGTFGKRLIHLANFRPQKDHLTLIRAFKLLIEKHPHWSLLLVGMNFKDDYFNQVLTEIQDSNLGSQVHVLGSRKDTAAILKAVDIGVLSSKSEGLPVALLEYGLAGLPVIVTDVGACQEVVAHSGKVVASEDAVVLSKALLGLINNPQQSKELGLSFQRHVLTTFGSSAYIKKLELFYSEL